MLQLCDNSVGVDSSTYWVQQDSSGEVGMSLTVKHIVVDGQALAYLEQGEGPLVICLHGFPDSAYSYAGLLPVLAAAGYRAVAPFLRGYYPSALAVDNDYSIPTVAGDVLALIAALGADKASVIGHDWGGFAAYTAANIAPQQIDKLVVMAVPHMHNTRFSLAQLRKSWYVLLFQLPWLPERLVQRNHFAFIEQLYRDWSPNWDEAEFALEPVKQALSTPRGLAAALSYYRTMFRGSTRRDRQLMSQRASVPALWIAGEADGSVGLDQFAGIEAAFTGYFELLIVDRAGHFVHREAADIVHNKLLEFLAA
jgi:pimeloyl-ACP methyl ester carboxylesterase